MSDIYTRHLYLDAAAKSLLCANDTHGSRHERRIDEARNNLIAALSGCEAGHTALAEQLLLDLIEDAISDSIDLDWTPKDAARSVLDALLNEVAPLPAKQEDAA